MQDTGGHDPPGSSQTLGPGVCQQKNEALPWKASWKWDFREPPGAGPGARPLRQEAVLPRLLAAAPPRSVAAGPQFPHL